MNKERFFITGGMGYIGSAFAREALKRGHDVCLYDSLIYEQNKERMLREISIPNIRDKKDNTELKFIIGDTRNIDLLEHSLIDFKPTYIMHWGELSSVYSCEHNTAYTEDINYNSSQKVIDVSEKLGLKVFYNSTSSVYGTQKENNLLTEDYTLPTPTDNYCRYKLKMEEYIKNKKSQNNNFQIIVFRPATVFGLSPRFRIELLPNHFTYMAVSRGLIRISELNAYRAAIDIDELIKGYFNVIEKGVWNNLIYNIGSYNFSKMQFATGIQNVVKCKIIPTHDHGDLRNLQIDCSLFNNEFDFDSQKPYEVTINQVASWLEKNLLSLEKNNFVELLNMPLDKWNKICN